MEWKGRNGFREKTWIRITCTYSSGPITVAVERVEHGKESEKPGSFGRKGE